MKRYTVQAVLSLILTGCLTVGQAGPAAIGMVVTTGSFEVDNTKVSGNATLFNGTMIQTGAAASELRLNSGTRVSLGAGARGRVYQDHLLLERGEGQLDAAGSYSVRARSLRILPEGAGSSGRIALAGASKVQVAAMAGRLRVTNSEGILVARVVPGSAIEFEPQAAGAAAPSRLSGCLQKKGNRYLLSDETTNVTVELEGAGLQSEAGNRVEITGTMIPASRPPADASQLIRVAAVKRLSKGCPASTRKAGVAAGAAAGAAGGTAAGAATGTTIAIVAGVAAAASVGGLAVAEKLPGQGDDKKPSTSR